LALAKYIVQRFILTIFVLLGVLLITFIISHSFGNPVMAWLGKSASFYPNLVDIYVKEYHLNEPLHIQFFYYIVGLLHGNLGYSPSQGFEPVTTVIARTLPYTIQIAFFAILFTLVIGFALGLVASLRYKKPIDKAIKGFYLSTYSSPPFFIALVLLVIFAYFFQLLPSGGAANPVLSVPRVVTGSPMFDSLISGDFAYFASSLQHVILPSLALSLTTFGVVTRMLRGSLLSVMHSNFIRTARSKGLEEKEVIIKHGLRNAMIPVVTVSSIVVAGLLTSTVFVESVFSYPGMGQYVVQAILAQDYPGILATTLIFALIIVITNLIADILYVIIDPQVKFS
jgi:peptide/nickel transport system permease protein